jgi:hypothetical protein
MGSGLGISMWAIVYPTTTVKKIPASNVIMHNMIKAPKVTMSM